MHCRLALAVALALAPTAPAADWPTFRGPADNGHVPAGAPLPLKWGPDTNVVWRKPIAGEGWSTPAIVGGKIYLTAAVPDESANDKKKGFSLRALALNARTGDTLWDREVFTEGPDAPRIHSKNSHASPSPIVEDGRLYVHFGHMGSACLDLDGNVVWKQPGLYTKPVHGNGGSPVLVDGKLIFSCDGGDGRFTAALDAKSGVLAWKAERKNSFSTKPFSFSTPAVIEVGGKKQVVSPGSDVVQALDPATGNEVWRVTYNGFSVIPKPVFGNGMVYVCTGYSTANLLAIQADGTGDVTATHVKWQTKRSVPHTPSLLLHGGELYMVSDGGIASCLDAKTGKSHWSERLNGGFSASPVFADGKVYFLSEEGVGTVVEAGTKYKVLAKNEMKEKTFASIAAADGAMFLRSDKALYRFAVK
jgi:outer membrane protein assembly factor BamB